MTDSVSSDWRARLIASIEQNLPPEQRAMLDLFARQARQIVRATVARHGSDLLTRMLAYPAVTIAYRRLLDQLGLEQHDPEPEFVLQMIDQIVDEVRYARNA